jgi:hypothetical protein
VLQVLAVGPHSDSAERILYAQNVAHRPTDLEEEKEKAYAILTRE